MALEEFKLQDNAAPFNMALSTLESLRAILSDIKQIYKDPFLPDEIKQKLKINLVKRFYVDSSPLLSQSVVDSYKDILELKPVKVIVLNALGNNGTSLPKKITYDEEMESSLDNYLIKLQIELQKEKYYMPPRKDKGSAVGSF